MTDKVFLDTNILVYSFDNNNLLKKERAVKLLKDFYESQNFFISTQVVIEFCNVAIKKMSPPLPELKIQEFINTFPAIKVKKLDIVDINTALYIKHIYQLSFWDSLIIACAAILKCELLYTEDLSDGQIIEDVRIVNPFKLT